MKIAVAIALGIASLYLIAWGATWLNADTSVVVITDRPGDVARHPGAFLGGLPPIPDVRQPWVQGVAVLLGAAGLIAAAVIGAVASAKRRRHGRPAES